MHDNYEIYVSEYLEDLEEKYGEIPTKEDLTDEDFVALIESLEESDWEGFNALVDHYKKMSFKGVLYDNHDEPLKVSDVYSPDWLKDGDVGDAPTLFMISTVGKVLNTCNKVSEKYLSTVRVVPR
jgi:hypothetical protein